MGARVPADDGRPCHRNRIRDELLTLRARSGDFVRIHNPEGHLRVPEAVPALANQADKDK